MTHLCVNPVGIDTPKTYSHVVVAKGARMVFVAGQYPEDADGKLVGPGDMAEQARQAFANLGLALNAVGARPEHVTKIDTPKAYSHGVVTMCARMVFVAGQYPEDAAGKLVGPGDMAEQARQAPQACHRRP